MKNQNDFNYIVKFVEIYDLYNAKQHKQKDCKDEMEKIDTDFCSTGYQTDKYRIPCPHSARQSVISGPIQILHFRNLKHTQKQKLCNLLC